MNLGNTNFIELQNWEKNLRSKHENYRTASLNLDLTRGKPSKEQLDLSDAMFNLSKNLMAFEDNSDLRNYGGLDGIKAAKKLGSEILGVHEKEVIAGDHSSLTLMYLYVLHAFYHGVLGPGTAWIKEGDVKFIAVVPGYDRHFSICQELGIQMINVKIKDDGPDMDTIEELVQKDSTIKGIWCVPKYSNPTGIIYSNEVVERIAALGRIAGPNFRVMWDNAYSVHDISETPQQLANVMDFCRKNGTEDNLILTSSTSKITFAGGGISFLGASKRNLEHFNNRLSIMSIGPNKLNQKRHILFLKNLKGINSHMQKHAKILRPKFEMVDLHLENGLRGKNVGKWTKPKGGYFVSFDSLDGLATEIIRLASQAGLKLTPAGSTFPYGKDPKDNNIRLAPTFPSLEELELAMEIFINCVLLASVRKSK